MVTQISVLGNLRVAGAVVVDGNQTDFPSNPRPGTLALKDGSLYAFTTIKGVLAWFPLFQNVSDAYLHTQVIPTTQWVVNHQLGAKHYWYQIQDVDGNNVYESSRIDSTDLNTTTLTFSEAVAGTVIFVGPNSVILSNINASLITVGNVEITTTSVKINGIDVLTSNLALVDQKIAAIKGNVAVGGDSLEKLYAIIQAIETTLQSDDVTLDTIQELVSRVKSDEGLLVSLTSGKVNVTDIVDNLNSSAANKPLSAAQGQSLSALIANEITNRILGDSAKQNTLVSGVNIKTLNGESLLGSGDLAIQAGNQTSGQSATFYANFSGAITPVIGTSRKYLRSDVNVTNIFACLGLVGSTDTVVNIRVNGVVKQSITILNGQQTSSTAVTLALKANDYITIDIVSGSGSDLGIRFDF